MFSASIRLSAWRSQHAACRPLLDLSYGGPDVQRPGQEEADGGVMRRAAGKADAVACIGDGVHVPEPHEPQRRDGSPAVGLVLSAIGAR